jgi:hypothetical protein
MSRPEFVVTLPRKMLDELAGSIAVTLLTHCQPEGVKVRLPSLLQLC